MNFEKFSSFESCSACDHVNPNNPINIKKGKNSQNKYQKLKDKYNKCVSEKCNNNHNNTETNYDKPYRLNIEACTRNCYNICNKINNQLNREGRLQSCLERCNYKIKNPYKPCIKWLENDKYKDTDFNNNNWWISNNKKYIKVNETSKKHCIKKKCNAESINVKDRAYNNIAKWSIDCNKGCHLKDDKCYVVLCPSSTKKYNGKCLSHKKMDPQKEFKQHPLVKIPIDKKWCINDSKVEKFSVLSKKSNIFNLNIKYSNLVIILIILIFIIVNC